MTESAWYVAVMLMSIAMFLTGAIIGVCKIKNGWPRRIISWIVPIILSMAAYFIGLYQVTEPVWLGIVTMCIVVALASNGLFEIPAMKAFIEMLFKYYKPTETKPAVKKAAKK